MSNPLVSVIIPNYNHAKYLDQRIQSVLNQTYKNFEVIILDDCSPDNGASRTVIEKYRDNPHVSHIVYNEVNSGSTFKQWHKGFELAKGELIWIAESDDSCDKCLLEELLLPFRKQKETVLSFCLSKIINEFGETTHFPQPIQSQSISGISFIRRYLSIDNTIRNASSALFSRVAALNVEPLYMKFKGAGDYLFWFEIAMQGNVSIINKPLNHFRRHQTVVSDKKSMDGSNMRDEHTILSIVYSKIHFSSTRRRYVNAVHARRAYYQEYNDTQTRESILRLWEYADNKKFLNRILLKYGSILKEKFNYMI